MSKYREAFEKWRLEFLENELKKAGGSVHRMALALGLNRGHAYKLCAQAGMKFGNRRPRALPLHRGNTAWQSLRAVRLSNKDEKRVGG